MSIFISISASTSFSISNDTPLFLKNECTLYNTHKSYLNGFISQLLHSIYGDRREDNPVSDLGHRWPGEIPEPRSHVPSGRRHSLASV